MRSQRAGGWIGVLSIGALAVTVAGAEEPPPVELERLMRLPDSIEFETTQRAGATRGEWKTRFAAARQGLADAQAALDESREKLEELAGEANNWQMSAPGVAANASGNPLSYELSQKMRRGREEVERSEGRLRELQIEANLAGVPADWQEE
ncbi:MAG: hypothetical protein V3U03_13895 [Myxococcota bacterium]